MSNKAILDAKTRLNSAMAPVFGSAATDAIPNQSVSQLSEQQIKIIEGEEASIVSGGRRRSPKLGKLAQIELVRQEITQLADAVIADPSVLDVVPTRGSVPSVPLPGVSL